MTIVTARPGTSAADAAASRWQPGGSRLGAGLRRGVAALDPLRIVGLLVLVAFWQVMTLFLPQILLPTPIGVFRRMIDDFWSAPSLSYFGISEASLYGNMIYTAENVAFAMVFGVIVGTVAGLVTARVSLARAIIDPIMLTAGTVPILVAAPFLLIWFGVGRASAVCLVAFYVVTILYIFAQRAAVNLDPIYEDSARTLGAAQHHIIRDLLLPATVPEILGGLRIALAGCWGLEAIAELLGAQQGMGKVLEVLSGATDPEGIMATLLVLGLVAVVADAIAAAAVARIASWNTPPRAGKE